MEKSAERTDSRRTDSRRTDSSASSKSPPTLPWQLFVSELVGTALLVALGLSVVIIDFGHGGAVTDLVHNAAARRAITGFAFGLIGALITFSAVGKVSGAHLNPVMSIAFWLERKLSARHLAGYLTAQFLGALAGAVPLLAWKSFGAGVHYGATIPGPQGSLIAALGEAATTFCLVFGIFTLLGSASLRRFTPLLLPPLYALMVWIEAPLSGTSTNPARSFGPAVVAADWQSFWVYLAGPIAGMLLAVALRRLPFLDRLEVEVAKVYHFAHDPHRVFRSPDDRRTARK
ncbi:MAG: MIP/aquaporin family protein [Acidimicrobiales bacterium]